VLDQVSFSIQPGEIVGLIGPNGSGKTTLLNILMGMFAPTSGSVRIQPNTKIGMEVSRRGFFSDMTVEKNILTFAALHGLGSDAVKQVLEEFNIDFGKLRFGKLSAGMKQRVTLAVAFLKKNDLILLDEPSNHLDIDSIIRLRSTISNTNKQGTAFLITSHILSDLEKVCTRLLFLKNGKLLSDMSKEELLTKYNTLEDAYLSIK